MSQTSRIALYFVCLFGWLLVGVVPAALDLREKNGVAQEVYFADVPLVPAPALIAEFKTILTSPPGESPRDYFDALDRVSELRVLFAKGEYASISVPDKIPYRVMTGIGTDGLNYEYRKKFGNEAVADAAEAWIAERQRTPLRTPDIPDYSGEFLWRAYITGMPFAAFFLILRLEAGGFSLLVETLNIWRLPFAVAFWFVWIFRYPAGDPKEQMVRGLRFATFVLATALSDFAGTAAAQTRTGTQEKKKRDPHTLQLDLRSSDALGDGRPDVFVRATAVTSRGFLFESVDTARSDRWNLSGGIGTRVAKTKSLVAYGLAGLARSSLGVNTVYGGGQAFFNTKRFGLLLPAVHYERRLRDGADGFNLVGFALAKAGRFRFGSDFSIKKTEGQKPQWSFGPLVARNTAKGFVEAAVVHNSQGEWRVRARLVHSFAW